MKVFLIFVLHLCLVAGDGDILCTSEFCDSWTGDNDCRGVPDNCEIQNGTHNGIFLPFPGPCSCCDFCAVNLFADDACTLGDPDSPRALAICGDGQFCTNEGGFGFCRRQTTECAIAQSDYDSRRVDGLVGHLEQRPVCNRRGLYAPQKCIPGEICYCLSEDGERVFGEIPFSSMAATDMKCACSRNYKTASDFIGRDLHPGEYLRCQSNGDFDPLQCIDDKCICVDPMDGYPMFSKMIPVNMTKISNETLGCFNNVTHVKGSYLRECEEKYIDILDEIAEYEEMGHEVFGYVFPNCQLDGYYGPVQQNETNKYCAAPNGTVLEDFILEVDDVLAETMICNCARARSIASHDLPECCPNGNYRPVQCRRGLCRCVDANGNQLKQEVSSANVEDLPCYSVGCKNDIGPRVNITRTENPTRTERPATIKSNI